MYDQPYIKIDFHIKKKKQIYKPFRYQQYAKLIQLKLFKVFHDISILCSIKLQQIYQLIF